ncbi:MAG: hypothetical protein JO222_07070 [Frankiales bacterium]|nr:hypothetical protein [Frankiales bacterium]
MGRPLFVGASAAAMLPSALAAALLVSAPFAGTRTTPLAAPVPHAPHVAAAPHQASVLGSAASRLPVHRGQASSGGGALQAAAETGLGVFTGVVVVGVRRRLRRRVPA